MDPANRAARIATEVIFEAIRTTPDAYQQSRQNPVDKETRPSRFGEAWIGCLRDAFEKRYPKHSWKCFAKGHQSGFRTGAGTARTVGSARTRRTAEEILFDVSVVEWGNEAPAPAPMPRTLAKMLPVLGRPVWQVESEISFDSRAVAYDLGKLVQGAAENKLLITRERDGRWAERYREFLVAASRGCTGRLFIAFVPGYDDTGFIPNRGRHISLRGLWQIDSGAMTLCGPEAERSWLPATA